MTAKPCPVCASPVRAVIEEELMRRPLWRVSHRWGTSRYWLRKHLNCCTPLPSTAVALERKRQQILRDLERMRARFDAVFPLSHP